ncbi:MAG: LysE family translocator [SAR324 cluster bacterium]|nr:LysE family translocator [SAR324 cluster bacterium]
MFETQILLFLVTSLIIIITPGQDMILVMSRSIALGSRAGIATATGISVGLLGHTILASLGLGAILRTSEVLFLVVKIIGAAYLIFLGIKLLKSRFEQFTLDRPTAASLRTLFFQGALSNLSNPKIAIFYFAFLPQFVPTQSTNPTPLLLTLGVSFAILTFLVKAPIGYGAGSLSHWLRTRPLIQLWINRISGTVLVALGIRLVFEKSA